MSAAVSPVDPLSSADAARGETLDRDNPWPGLAAFHEGDAAFFHGREAEALDLFLLVRREILTVLFGISGLGKTSLLLAGVFPLLRAESYLPVYLRINHDHRAPPPLRQVLNALRRAAEEKQIEAPSADVDTLWEFFHREDALFWSKQNEIVTPVLVFDQFEECFVEGRSTPERERRTAELFTQLADLIEDRSPEGVQRKLDADPDVAQQYDFVRNRYRVVISLRKDFVADLDDLREQMPSIANRVPLRRMNGDAALNEVVLKPGLVDRATGEAIVRYVAGASSQLQSADGSNEVPLRSLHVEPALLSLFCSELNRARRATDGQQMISMSLFEANRKEILKGFYDACMRGRPRKVQVFVEEELLTQSGSRKSAAVEDILEAYGDVQGDIAALIDLRLLRREKRDGLEWIELTHDRLTQVVRESRDRRHDQEQIQRAEEQARAEQARRVEAERREAQRRRQLLTTAVLLAITLVLLWKATTAWMDATRQQAKANYQNGLFQLHQGRSRTALAYLAHGFALDEQADLRCRWLGGPCLTTPFSTALLSSLWYTRWPTVTLAHADGFFSAILSSDGNRVLTIGSDRRVRWWNAYSGDPVAPPLTYGNGVLAATIAADDSHFVTISDDGVMRFWNAQAGTPERELSLGASIQCAAFDADGSELVVAPDKNRTETIAPARVWSAQSQQVAPLAADMIPSDAGVPVCPVALSADGTRVVTGLRNGGAQAWDARSGLPIGGRLHDAVRVSAVAADSQGRRIATGATDGWMRLRNLDRQSADEWKAHERSVSAVAFSPDDTRVVTASEDGTARVWDSPADGKPITPAGPPLRHEDSVWAATFDASGARVLTASADGTVQIWDAQTRELAHRTLGHEKPVHCAVYSPDGQQLFTAADDGARLWNAHREDDPRMLPATGVVLSAAFDAAGDRFVTGGQDCAVQLWDAHTGNLVRQIGRHGSTGDLFCTVRSVAFDADGTRIVSASADMTAQVWDARSPTPRAIGKPMQHGAEVVFASFLADGRILTAGDKQVLAWDSSGRQHMMINSDTVIWSANISPDGQRIVIGTEGCTAQVFDLAGKPIGEPLRPGQRCAIHSVAFSPDGNLVVTGSNDGTARLWDARTGTRIGEPLTHQQAVEAVAFSPDGTSIATASADGTARLWDVAPAASMRPADLVAFAEAVAGASVDAKTGTVHMVSDRNHRLADLRAAVANNGAPAAYDDLVLRFFSQQSASPDRRAARHDRWNLRHELEQRVAIEPR